MGVPKIPGQGGSRGKRRHSNMEHSGFTDETKEAAHRVRRLESKRVVRDGLLETGSVRLARMDPAGIPALRDAIKHLHGLDATWLESVPVHEKHEGRTVW